MAKVLVVYYTLGGNTKAAAEHVAAGVRSVRGCEAVVKTGLEAAADDLLACQALAVGTPDYFSYMAGGLKDFFDRAYYPTQGQVTDKPCGIFVTHGGGGAAVKSVKDLCRAFKFRLAAEPVLVKNAPDAKAAEDLRRLGALVGKLAGEA